MNAALNEAKDLFSHSRLSCFEQCALKYKFRYLDRIETEEMQSVEAFMGTLVHATLEKLYRDVQFQKPVSLEELLSFYDAEWKKGWNASIVINKEYEEENYRKMGEKYLSDYYKKHFPFDQSRTIALEKRVTIDLNGIKMQGIIDRLAYTDNGVYEVHDYKTSLSLPTQGDFGNDRQLALYSIAVRNDYPDAKEVRLVWHYLAFAKDVTVIKTVEELEKLKRETSELIRKIQFSKEYPARVSKLCDWCEFMPICPQWSHVLKTKELALNEYLNDPGVALVNKYVELQARRKKLLEDIDLETDKVKDAILEFSRKEDSETIAGSEFTARVKVFPKVTIPPRGEAKRDVLEKLIKSYGKWEDVSELSPFLLSRILEEGPWPPEFAQQVRNFIEEGKRIHIFLNKMERDE